MAFTIGQRYPRTMLNEKLGGGGRLVGIIHTPKRPGVVICTSGGEYVQVAGFEDGPTDDGLWHYSGQQGGRRGPRASAANRALQKSRIVLLFTAHEPTPEERELHGAGQQYQYEGAFHVRDEKIIEKAERAAGTDEWQMVGERLLFVLEPCDQQCEAYRDLREQGMIA